MRRKRYRVKNICAEYNLKRLQQYRASVQVSIWQKPHMARFIYTE